MADIEQSPGTLNISKLIKGDDFTFSIVMDGDVSADTFVAKIDNGNLPDVTITIGKTYSGITLKTTITFTLTAVQTATLELSTLPWYCTWTAGGKIRTLLTGTMGVYAR